MRLLSSLVLLLPIVANAQWSPLATGMLSNRSLTSINGDLYCATYPNGVKKSVDGTGPWTAVNTGLPLNGANCFVQSVGTDGAYLYAGTESGIYRSTSGTDDWSSINGSLTANSTVYANKFFAFGSNILAVFTGSIGQGGGIQRSGNFGNTWLIGHSGMGSNVVVNHITQVGGTLWASTSVGLYTSVDNAQNWTPVAAVNYTTFSLAAIGNRLVIVSTFGIRYSTDNGGIWNEATGDPSNPTDGEIIAFDGKLFALMNQPTGCLRSVDNGSTWSDYNTGFSPVDAASQEEFFSLSSTLYCTALFDIYSIAGTNTVVSDGEWPARPLITPTLFTDGFNLVNVSAGDVLRVFDASGRPVLIQRISSNNERVAWNGRASGAYFPSIVHRDGTVSRLNTIVAE